jgi:hypothetical protein
MQRRTKPPAPSIKRGAGGTVGRSATTSAEEEENGRALAPLFLL